MVQEMTKVIRRKQKRGLPKAQGLPCSGATGMSLILTSDRFLWPERGEWPAAHRAGPAGHGYGDPVQGGAILTPGREELDLRDDAAVSRWMISNRPDVVLAAATVGGIEANRSRPADFLLENLQLKPT